MNRPDTRLQELLMQVHHCRTAVGQATSDSAKETANRALKYAYHQVRKHCEDHRLALPHDIPEAANSEILLRAAPARQVAAALGGDAMKPTSKREITRQAWRRILHDMGDDVFEDYLTNEEQAMYFHKVLARLPDGDPPVEEALTEEDLIEILIDVLEETRGDEDLD